MKKIITTKDLVKRSTRAVCGVSEREVTVKTKNVESAINKLKKSGYYVVGTSYDKTPTKKIWFTRPGLL